MWDFCWFFSDVDRFNLVPLWKLNLEAEELKSLLTLLKCVLSNMAVGGGVARVQQDVWQELRQPLCPCSQRYSSSQLCPGDEGEGLTSGALCNVHKNAPGTTESICLVVEIL